MIRKVDDREYALRVLQDLKVKARDCEDYRERLKMEKVIKKFEKGIVEEYGG
ncbi:MAG: hypothetical protein GF364_04010 [Candidatus Lokiarchaeota archaeon]|nr:hypothetical protein [Candidatus Lokiarchaeota archaeon]